MKIDRLLGVIIYLLNRDTVNAGILAEKFEVSIRTIQRDIETLNQAGIPIMSVQGANGGYGIMEGFRLEKQITGAEDYLFIITALMGLCSAYNNSKLQATLEKLLTGYKEGGPLRSKIKLDFSTAREGSNIDEYLKIIEKAAAEEHIMEFEYTNSYGNKKLQSVEPIGAVYKWYAWYMLAYCIDKKDYRLYKIARMRKLRKLSKLFSSKHENLDKLLTQYEKQDCRKFIDVKLLCRKEIRISMEEYFPGGSFTDQGDGDFMLQFTVPENETVWKGILLTYGNKINILEPLELKVEFLAKANEIIENYKKEIDSENKAY